jgi:5-methylcytosine-specific restriction endonuclease McrA
MLDPTADLQHDHIVEHSKGGKTLIENQRLVHPFCNNPSNREIIESGRNGVETIKLPRFVDPDLTTEPEQLKLAFFEDPDFN